MYLYWPCCTTPWGLQAPTYSSGLERRTLPLGPRHWRDNRQVSTTCLCVGWVRTNVCVCVYVCACARVRSCVGLLFLLLLWHYQTLVESQCIILAACRECFPDTITRLSGREKPCLYDPYCSRTTITHTHAHTHTGIHKHTISEASTIYYNCTTYSKQRTECNWCSCIEQREYRVKRRSR